jgi:integrase
MYRIGSKRGVALVAKSDLADKIRQQLERAALLHPVFRIYVEQQISRGRSYSAITALVLAGESFETYLSEQGLAVETVTPDALAGWLAAAKDGQGRPYAVGTRLALANQVRAAYRRGVERYDWNPEAEGAVRRTPFVSTVEMPRRGLSVPDMVTPDELVGCFRWADKLGWRAALALRLFVYTGMRRAEVLGLRWEDVDYANATIHVLGKGGYPRSVPLCPVLLEALMGVRDLDGREGRRRIGFILWRDGFGGGGFADRGRPYSDVGLRLMFRKFTDRNFHDYRKTVATRMHEAGVAEELVFEVLGWKKQTVFGRFYYAPSGEARAAAVQAIWPSEVDYAAVESWRDVDLSR